MLLNKLPHFEVSECNWSKTQRVDGKNPQNDGLISKEDSCLFCNELLWMFGGSNESHQFPYVYTLDVNENTLEQKPSFSASIYGGGNRITLTVKSESWCKILGCR